MNSIFTRRSVRTFCDKIVEDEKITKILQAAMQSPSAMNQQPWEFIVVKDREILNRLSTFKGSSTKSLEMASHAIVVLGNHDKIVRDIFIQNDLGACTQNILLEATELGLGTVWIGVVPQEHNEILSEILSLESSQFPFSIIAVGYPETSDANKFVDRFDASRVKYL